MSSVKLDGVLKAVKQVRGGVHVNHNKNTADCEVVRIPVPEKVLLPMQQHIGVPCTPTVKAGDKDFDVTKVTKDVIDKRAY